MTVCLIVNVVTVGWDIGFIPSPANNGLVMIFRVLPSIIYVWGLSRKPRDPWRDGICPPRRVESRRGSPRCWSACREILPRRRHFDNVLAFPGTVVVGLTKLERRDCGPLWISGGERFRRAGAAFRLGRNSACRMATAVLFGLFRCAQLNQSALSAHAPSGFAADVRRRGAGRRFEAACRRAGSRAASRA